MKQLLLTIWVALVALCVKNVKTPETAPEAPAFSRVLMQNAEDGVTLSWIYPLDSNLNHFIVQGSSDSINWENRGLVFPGESMELPYFFTDKRSGKKNIQFYRIVQQAKNGMETISAVSQLVEEESNPEITVTQTANGFEIGAETVQNELKVSIWSIGSGMIANSTIRGGTHQFLIPDGEANSGMVVVHIYDDSGHLYLDRFNFLITQSS